MLTRKTKLFSTVLLTLTLLTPQLCSAKSTALTKKELQIGQNSIKEFKAALPKADKEDQKLYELLTKNKNFFAIWSRALADRENASKMKALIRVCRKQKLWENVDWMLDELKKIDGKKPAYYRLKALARYEAGRLNDAIDAAHWGVGAHPFHRGLRRIFTKLQLEKDTPPSRLLIGNLEELKFIVHRQLCRERAKYLLRSLDFTTMNRRLAAEIGSKKPTVDTLVRIWQEHEAEKNMLPSTFDKDHKCHYLALGDEDPVEEGFEFMYCRKHGCYYAQRSRDREYRLFRYRVKRPLLLEAMTMEDNDCAQKAAEYILRLCTKLSENEEKLVANLVKRESLTEIQRQKLLSSIIFYLRHYELGDELKQTLYARSEKTQGYCRAAHIIIQGWYGDIPKKIDEETALALFNREQPLYLLALERRYSFIDDDYEKIVLDYYKPLGRKGLDGLNEMFNRRKVYCSDLADRLYRHIEKTER